jgi:PAS domain S-box-containing protein
MRQEVLTFLVPHAVSLAVETCVGAYALVQRRVRAAPQLAFCAFSQASWTLGSIFEALAPTLEGKVRWDDFQFIGAGCWFLGMLAFAVRFTDRKLAAPRLVWGVTAAIFATYLGLVFTDPFHHLIRPEVHLAVVAGIPVLVYPFTWITWVAYLYFMGAFFAGIVFLVEHALNVQTSYRGQSAFIVGGTSVPMVGITLTMTGLVPDLYRDTTPFTFAIGDLLIAWGLLRHRLLDVVPVARNVVFENLKDRVIVVDEQNRIVDLNPEVPRRLARPQSELIGKPAAEVFGAWADMIARFAGVEEIHTETNTRGGGTDEHFDIRITPIRNRREELVGRVIVAHDITALKQAQHELEDRNAELSAANVELDAFSYTVSHDLRAPLRAIASFSKRLAATEGLPPDSHELARRIEANATRMQQLTDDLLAFAKLGRKPLRKELVQVSDVVREVVEPLHARVEQGLLELRVAELPACRADPSLLRQVFENLVGNAVKFASRSPAPRIEIGGSGGSAGTTYFVRDNGIGFDQAFADKLFVAFQRLHDETEVEGTGIGLATVKQIVTRHGGTVWAESAPGAGATFYFRL